MVDIFYLEYFHKSSHLRENVKLAKLVMEVKCLLKEFQKSGPW